MIKWQQATTHRLRLLVWILVDIATPMLMIIIFSSIYTHPDLVIRGYSYSSLVTYYLLTVVIGIFIETHVDEDLEELIRSGDLANYLLKPISLIAARFVNEIAWKAFKFLLYLPLLVLLFGVLKDKFTFNLPLRMLPVLIPSLLLASLLFFLIRYCLGLLSLFFTDVHGLSNLQSALIRFGSGQLIPIAFFPDLLQTINRWLPFQYLLAFPIAIAQNQTRSSDLLWGFAGQVFYVSVFLWLQSWLIKKGLRQFEAVGR